MCSSSAPMTGQNFLKASKTTSAQGTTTNAGQSNGTDASRHSRSVDGFALSGVSNLPDTAFHAYRKDLADAALAGQVIASHYAEPLVRHLVAAAPFLVDASDDAETIAQL